jgi:glutathione synthase/RimK-type ligase-like ATP-grasp enzyme
MSKELYILTDGEGDFLISMEDLLHFTSMNTAKLKTLFEEQGFTVQLRKFAELDLTLDFKGTYVLYQTSEKRGPFYKHYIEDLIYFLERQGAILLPGYEQLKAHHDKCFMEILRLEFQNPELKSLRSWCFGSWEEAMEGMPCQFPLVLKQSAGSGSEGVYLARNAAEYRKYAQMISQVAMGPDGCAVAREGLKQSIRKIFSPLVKTFRENDPPVREPIVVQEFVPNLAGDYKVVVFGGKYYILYRQNRENDFRASGGGKLFVVPEEQREDLLDFARKAVQEIDFPLLGLDLAYDGSRYHLLEFQSLHLGPYTLQAAEFWHEYVDGKWVQFDGKSDLEVEFCRSLCAHIDAQSS